MKKTVQKRLAGVFLISLALFGIMSWFQIRPANTMNHPGIWSPWSPPEQGPNHAGPSDYGNKWNWVSELCEVDHQLRPANQGYNIRRFYFCGSDDD